MHIVVYEIISKCSDNMLINRILGEDILILLEASWILDDSFEVIPRNESAERCGLPAHRNSELVGRRRVFVRPLFFRTFSLTPVCTPVLSGPLTLLHQYI